MQAKLYFTFAQAVRKSENIGEPKTQIHSFLPHINDTSYRLLLSTLINLNQMYSMRLKTNLTSLRGFFIWFPCFEVWHSGERQPNLEFQYFQSPNNGTRSLQKCREILMSEKIVVHRKTNWANLQSSNKINIFKTCSLRCYEWMFVRLLTKCQTFEKEIILYVFTLLIYYIVEITFWYWRLQL